jgi:hypothetical protein
MKVKKIKKIGEKYTINSGSSIPDKTPALHFTAKMQSSGECLSGEWKRAWFGLFPCQSFP